MVCLSYLDDEALGRQAQQAFHRFATAGALAVAIVLATGAINTELVLGRWPIDMGSTYQALLAAKIACIVAMLGLAALNRFVLVPAVVSGDSSGIRALRLSIAAESGLAGIVFLLVGFFGMLEPV
jgi:putative copper resistance protein D